MREFIINGSKFHTKKAFYKYTEELFTFGLNWKTGRNLNAFSDILRGGFGQHDCGEEIKITWINMSKSRERLPSKFFEAVVEILESAENVVFENLSTRYKNSYL